ncbi:trimethylguanosine synthase-like isoform X2 [Cydia splendana]|uniref:trimethylguanosine synthase-like isoform X2 n=1 Tax=Cydia splendana TaxID=1100963 RepID=UPI0028F482DE
MPQRRANNSEEVNNKKVGRPRQRRRQPKKKRIEAMRKTVKSYDTVQFPPECAWRKTLGQIPGAPMQSKTSRRGRKYLYPMNQVPLVDVSAVEDTLTDFGDWSTNNIIGQKAASLEAVERNFSELQIKKPRPNQLKGVNRKKINKQRQRQLKNKRVNKALQQAQLQTLLEHELVAETPIADESSNLKAVGNTNASQKCNIPRPNDFALMPPELQEDPTMWKYWKKRKYLFSRYDEGIKLDKESWYSVTPEPIARQIAERRQYDLIMDPFCGAGGNTIQFAKNCGQKVQAIDIDPKKVEMARHNSTIYGVEDRIQFFVGDFFEMAKLAPFLKADMVFLSPPWGGPNYVKDKPFDIETLEPRPASELVRAARKISSSVTLYLPRNSNRDQIQSLADENDIVEIKEMMGGRTGQGKSFQALVVYYIFSNDPVPSQMVV